MNCVYIYFFRVYRPKMDNSKSVAVCYLYEYYVYSVLFLTLFITSIIHHTNYTDTSVIVDKIAVLAVVFYGGYVCL